MLQPEFIADLQHTISGEVKTDPITKVLYSTDASIHKIAPLGVVFPRFTDEIAPIVQLCNQYQVPIIPRGSGSGLAGQAIGKGLIIDCSRYLNRLVSVNPVEKSAVVEPGMILDEFNRQVKRYGLTYGPDPASSERATLGGCIGNNAAGAHSIQHGMTADHLLALEVVLVDGSITTFNQVSLDTAQAISDRTINSGKIDIEKQLYQAALQIRENYQEEIVNRWPKTWRRVSGYNLNYLLPWSPVVPPQWDLSQSAYPPVLPGTINLAQLMAGSEGTLGFILKSTVRLVPIKKYSELTVINFPSIIEACDIVPEILELFPSAVELIPQSLIRLARSVPAYAHLLSFVVGDPAAILVVEFSGDDAAKNSAMVNKLCGFRNWMGKPYIAETARQQKQVWDVRKVGLGILMSRLGDAKPISFIEDMSVPVERLGEFVTELDEILKGFGTEADYYGHASAGCLHIRPLLNVKTPHGRIELRSIAEAAVDLVIRLGGAVSGEHGDGITRGEWIERAYGPMLLEAFREIKQAADPEGILNPGKIVDTPKMDSSLRYDDEYHPVAWTPIMTFSSYSPDAKGLIRAIEQCNGAGVCRKSNMVMCPSFQATQNEMFSTRGRANLLRALISDEFHDSEIAIEAAHEALDLCLACKGCKAECPSAVDMAKLKYEFYQHYHKLPGHRHPLRDYIFGYISLIAKLSHNIAPVVNFFLSSPLFGGLRENLVGLSRNRVLPRLAQKSLQSRFKGLVSDAYPIRCLFLSDAFNEYFFPETGIDAVQVLIAAGMRPKFLSTIGAGRTLISKGFLDKAKSHARLLVDEIVRLDPDEKLPIIGLEPSELYTLKDEFLDLLPGERRVTAISERAFMIDEFLLRPGEHGIARLSEIRLKPADPEKRTYVLVHGHCYQKAQPQANDGYPNGVTATAAMLEGVGYEVNVIDDGCCGMAGAFGYETEHYDVSMKVGELALLPAIRSTDHPLIAAAGISCQAQIIDSSGIKAFHPISLIARKCDEINQ